MAIVNITTENDADFIRGFIYQTNAEPPVPVDLTGNTMRMGIRRRAEDATEEMLLTTNVGGGLVITDPVNGRFTLAIKQKQLLELPVGEYEHSLIRTTPAGDQLRIWSGSLINNAGASR